eukprot:609627_1
MDKDSRAMCGVFLLCVGLLGIIQLSVPYIIEGQKLIQYGDYIIQESTKEACLLEEYELDTCTHIMPYILCCSTYYATAPQKCNNTLLEGDHFHSEDCTNSTLGKQRNESYVCYVPACDDEVFSFTSGQQIEAFGDERFVGGLLVLTVGLVCFLPVVIIGCKSMWKADDETHYTVPSDADDV